MWSPRWGRGVPENLGKGSLLLRVSRRGGGASPPAGWVAAHAAITLDCCLIASRLHTPMHAKTRTRTRTHTLARARPHPSCLIIGTMDGANIEIAEESGKVRRGGAQSGSRG
jgi:hypothetical protein